MTLEASLQMEIELTDSHTAETDIPFGASRFARVAVWLVKRTVPAEIVRGVPEIHLSPRPRVTWKRDIPGMARHCSQHAPGLLNNVITLASNRMEMISACPQLESQCARNSQP